MVNFCSCFQLNYIQAYRNSIGAQSFINCIKHYPITLTDPQSVDVSVTEGIIRNVSNVDNSSVSIIIPPEVFNNSKFRDEEEIAMVFAEYDSSTLYPLPSNSVLFTDENVTYTNFSVASTLLTATIVGHEDDIVDLDVDITLVLKLESQVFS